MNGSVSNQAFAEETSFDDFGYDDSEYENALLAEYDYDIDDDDFEVEDYDDEAAQAEFIAPLISGVANSAIRGIKGVSNLLTAPSKPRQFRKPSRTTGAQGVRSARLNTPRGSATVQLPASVPTLNQYMATVKKLEGQIGNLTTGLNRTQADLHKERQRITQAAALAAGNKEDISKLRSSTGKALVRQRRELADFKKEQASQAMMNMMLGMMQTQRLREQLSDHTHVGQVFDNNGQATGDVVQVNTAQSADSDDNSFLMLLPLMMSQGGSNNDNMLPLMLMTMSD